MDKDEQIIQEYLDRKTKKEEPEQPPSRAEKEDEIIQEFLSGDQEAGPLDDAADAGDPAAQRLKEESDGGEQEKEQEKEQGGQGQDFTVSNGVETLSNQTNRFVDWAGSRPTPGGLWPLLLALFFFIWVIVPVNSVGDTRMSLLWALVSGRLGWSPQFIPADQRGGGSGGGDFGNGGVSPSVIAADGPIPPYIPDFGVY
jgi:hypothetical protein